MSYRRRLPVLLAAVAACLPAADPTPDPGFGEGGEILHSAPQWVRRHQQVLVDGRGRLLVLAVNAVYGGGGTSMVLRLGADGGPDPSWGDEGIVRLQQAVGLDPAEGTAVAIAMALAPDGSLVVLWKHQYGHNSWPRLSRLDADGGLVTGFGDGGVMEVAGDSTAYEHLALDDAGRIVLAAPFLSGDYRLRLLRFGAGGSPDPSFSDDGQREVSWSPWQHNTASRPRLAALAIDGEDRILILGSRYDAGEDELDLQVLRLAADGAADTAFSGDGFAVLEPDTAGSRYYGADLAVDGDDRPLLLASESDGGGYVHRVLRLTTAGAVDAAFAGGGFVMTPIGGALRQRGLVAAPDGGAWVSAGVGPVIDGTTSSGLAVWRLDAAGAPVASFGGDGVATWTSPAGWTVDPLDLALAAEGPLVAGLEQEDGTYGYGLMVAFDAVGDLRDGFADGGVLRALATEDTRNQLASLDILPGGRILLGGSKWATRDGNPQDGILARLAADGSLDPTFGRDGWVAEHEAWFAAAGSDGTGRIRCLGPAGGAVQAHLFGYNDLTLHRYLADGDPDAGFGTGGRRTTALSAQDDYALEMLVLPDGASVSACYDKGAGRHLVVRHRADGTLDPTFAGDGVLELDIVWLNNLVDVDGGKVMVTSRIGLALLDAATGAPDAGFGDDGQLDELHHGDELVRPECARAHGDGFLVGGYIGGVGAGQGILLRLRPDGTPDPAFGSAGAVTGIGAEVTEILVDGAGRILTVGHTTAAVVLGRFAADGTADATFGDGGTFTRALPGGRVPYFQQDHRVLARLDTAGRLLVGATCTTDYRPEDLWLARFVLPDGDAGDDRTIHLSVVPTIVGLEAAHLQTAHRQALDPEATFSVPAAADADFGFVPAAPAAAN